MQVVFKSLGICVFQLVMTGFTAPMFVDEVTPEYYFGVTGIAIILHHVLTLSLLPGFWEDWD